MKIMIFGRPGSGKTTAAYQLANDTGLPLFHLDKIFYGPNWIPRPVDDFLADQHRWVNQPQWIIDGNNSSSFETRWARADIVFYFNLPRWMCLFRIFKRFVFGNICPTDDRADGCRDTIRWDLLIYMWTFSTRVTSKIDRMRTRFPKAQFIEISKRNEFRDRARDYLATAQFIARPTNFEVESLH